MTYPKLVREFYENIRVAKFHVDSIVKGKRILINEETLSAVLGIPNQGVAHLFLHDDERLRTRQIILESEDVNLAGNVSANQLSLEMRLLHHFVARIFTPRTGRFDWVSDKDIVLMRHLIEEIQVNQSYIMLVHIREAERKVNASLPYGMVFTRLFKHYRVNLDNEVGKALLPSDVYSDKSLGRMGYIFVDGAWKKKRTDQTDQGDEADAEPEPPSSFPGAGDFDFSAGPSAAPPPPPPFCANMDHLSDLFANLSSSINSRFDSMESKFDEKFTDLQSQITYLADQYSHHPSHKDQATSTEDIESDSDVF